jgi:hypothetical protein
VKTIVRRYWCINQEEGTEPHPDYVFHHEYFSLKQAEYELGIACSIYPGEKFFISEHQKDIEIKEDSCGYCGAKEGDFHDIFCDYERCPFCNGQLAGCGCVYDWLKIRDKEKYGPETNYLPPDIYSGGLTEQQREDWTTLLVIKGRIRFIRYPLICAKCGKLWPDFFMVPDHEWKHYIQSSMREKIICMDCYTTIKYLIDSGEEDNA